MCTTKHNYTRDLSLIQKLTNFPVSGDVAAAAADVSQAAIPSQSVHDPRGTDCVHERCLSGGCHRATRGNTHHV